MCPNCADGVQLSRAFGHYWEKTGIDRKVSLKHLRKTYVTLQVALNGVAAGSVTGQTLETIMKHYLDGRKIVKRASKVSLREIEAMLESGKIPSDWNPSQAA